LAGRTTATVAVRPASHALGSRNTRPIRGVQR
jgi:hypothetical protein